MERAVQTVYTIRAAVRERINGAWPAVSAVVNGGSYTRIMDLESFRDTFSPSRIFAQIIILQSVYYLTALAMFCLLASLAGYPFSFDWVFSWEPITFENALGLTLTVCWLIDSLFCIGFMTVIVGRSKLAWDFALTIHAINFIVCWVYSRKFPVSLLWWVLQVVSSVILVSLGTWSTRWRELRDTFFEGLNDTAAQGGAGAGPAAGPAAGPSIPMESV